VSYKGTVKNGVVILPVDAELSDGTEVEIVVPESAPNEDFTQMLENIAKEVQGLPADLAQHHDHYLYGTPKE